MKVALYPLLQPVPFSINFYSFYLNFPSHLIIKPFKRIYLLFFFMVLDTWLPSHTAVFFLFFSSVFLFLKWMGWTRMGWIFLIVV